MRIVSLIPSATEILFAVGAGDDVVGVTFECDHPARGPRAAGRVVDHAPRGADPARDRRRRGAARSPRGRTSTASTRTPWPTSTPTSSSPRTSARSVPSTSPSWTTPWPTSAAPPRCSPSTRTPSTTSSAPSWRSVVRPATTDDGAHPRRVAARAAGRACARGSAGRERPRVLVLEWTDPPYAPGPLDPGDGRRRPGESRCSAAAGEKSVRVTWDAVHAARPDVVVVAPCGFDRTAAPAAGRRPRGGRAPPGRRGRARRRRQRAVGPARPRLVDGVEELAALLHP